MKRNQQSCCLPQQPNRSSGTDQPIKIVWANLNIRLSSHTSSARPEGVWKVSRLINCDAYHTPCGPLARRNQGVSFRKLLLPHLWNTLNCRMENRSATEYFRSCMSNYNVLVLGQHFKQFRAHFPRFPQKCFPARRLERDIQRRIQTKTTTKKISSLRSSFGSDLSPVSTRKSSPMKFQHYPIEVSCSIQRSTTERI